MPVAEGYGLVSAEPRCFSRALHCGNDAVGSLIEGTALIPDRHGATSRIDELDAAAVSALLNAVANVFEVVRPPDFVGVLSAKSVLPRLVGWIVAVDRDSHHGHSSPSANPRASAAARSAA